MYFFEERNMEKAPFGSDVTRLLSDGHDSVFLGEEYQQKS